MELTTTELLDPNLFQRRCADTINSVPPVPSRIIWHKIVSDAMEKVVIIEASQDASPEGQFWEHVDKFCSGKAKAMSMEEILLGKPYEEAGRVYFRIMDLEKFLDQQRFREFKTNKVTSLLRDHGAVHMQKKLKGKGTNIWSLALGDQQQEGHAVPDSVKKGDDAY